MVSGIKSQLGETFLWLSGFVLMLAVSVFFVLLAVSGAYSKGTAEIREQKLEAGDTLFLLSYLQTDNVSDIVARTYFAGSDEELRKKTNDVLTEVFDRKICWKIFINEMEVKDTSDCEWLENTVYGDINARVYLPRKGTVLVVRFGDKA